MKTFFTLFSAFFLLIQGNYAAATYTISSNTTWTAAGIPSTCNTCTITIASGATLTINASETCQSCTFNGGGTISLTNYTLTLQSSLINFNGVTMNVYGTATVSVSTALTLTNTVFNFYNTSYLNTQGTLNMDNSQLYFNDASNMLATGSPVNMKNNSRITIGNGSSTSTAYVNFNGPVLNIYDNSYVTLGNDNNYFSSWNGYNYYATSTSTTHTSTSTSNSTINCNSGATTGYPNSCSQPKTYGPATMNAGGTTSTATLPVTLTGFTALAGNNNTTVLDWATTEEVSSGVFTIQRSSDGADWNPIGTVRANGNASGLSNYTFTDNNPLNGVNYYRLAITDLDGRTAFSAVRIVKASVISGVSFFPNPARDYVNVSIGQTAASEITVSLVSQSGQVLQTKTISGGNGGVVSFAVQQYTAGLYLLHVSAADGTRQNSKLLITK